MNEIIIVLLALLGLVAHFLKKLIEAKQSGNGVTFRQYYLANPYSTLSSVVLCLAGMAMLWGSDELTRVTAFMLGYMADSVISAIIRRQHAAT